MLEQLEKDLLNCSYVDDIVLEYVDKTNYCFEIKSDKITSNMINEVYLEDNEVMIDEHFNKLIDDLHKYGLIFNFMVVGDAVQILIPKDCVNFLYLGR